MNVIGIRCSNKDFTYAVMTGSKSQPVVVHSTAIAVPPTFTPPRALWWMVQEIEKVITQHDATKIVMKRFEGRGRDKTFSERIELEAAVFVAAGKNGVNRVLKKGQSTIAKDLGLKGRPKYLKTQLDTSVLPNYSNMREKEKDAVLAGWSEL